jgi:hypothetical protein
MNLFESFQFDWLKQLAGNVWSLLCGLFFASVGYLLPVKNIVHTVLFFFLLDIIFGYWAARKLRGEHFSTKIVWKYTVPRMLISIVLIISTYMWDTNFGQDMVNTYNLIGWFISGILIYSIFKNAYKITLWLPFKNLGLVFKNQMKNETGINVEEESKTNQPA